MCPGLKIAVAIESRAEACAFPAGLIDLGGSGWPLVIVTPWISSCVCCTALRKVSSNANDLKP